MTTMSPPIVSLRDVAVTYVAGPRWNRRYTPAVRSVSIDIGAGRTLGLVGESGSGKSTIGRVMLGILGVGRGTATFREVPAPDARRKFRGQIQAVWQHPEWSLNPFLRTGTSVGEPLAVVGGENRATRRMKVAHILERVGLDPSLAGRFPHELSGGQRQRASIARALISQPGLVVFDEAVSALDASAQAQVLNLIRETQEEQGYAALFISHEIAAVRYVAHEIAVMYAGEIVSQGKTSAYYGKPKHPYAQALLAAASLGQNLTAVRDAALAGLPASGCPLQERCPLATDHCRAEKPELRTVGDEWSACHRAEEL